MKKPGTKNKSKDGRTPSKLASTGTGSTVKQARRSGKSRAVATHASIEKDHEKQCLSTPQQTESSTVVAGSAHSSGKHYKNGTPALELPLFMSDYDPHCTRSDGVSTGSIELTWLYIVCMPEEVARGEDVVTLTFLKRYNGCEQCNNFTQELWKCENAFIGWGRKAIVNGECSLSTSEHDRSASSQHITPAPGGLRAELQCSCGEAMIDIEKAHRFSMVDRNETQCCEILVVHVRTSCHAADNSAANNSVDHSRVLVPRAFLQECLVEYLEDSLQSSPPTQFVTASFDCDTEMHHYFENSFYAFENISRIFTFFDDHHLVIGGVLRYGGDSGHSAGEYSLSVALNYLERCGEPKVVENNKCLLSGTPQSLNHILVHLECSARKLFYHAPQPSADKAMEAAVITQLSGTETDLYNYLYDYLCCSYNDPDVATPLCITEYKANGERLKAWLSLLLWMRHRKAVSPSASWSSFAEAALDRALGALAHGVTIQNHARHTHTKRDAVGNNDFNALLSHPFIWLVIAGIRRVSCDADADSLLSEFVRFETPLESQSAYVDIARRVRLLALFFSTEDSKLLISAAFRAEITRTTSSPPRKSYGERCEKFVSTLRQEDFSEALTNVEVVASQWVHVVVRGSVIGSSDNTRLSLQQEETFLTCLVLFAQHAKRASSQVAKIFDKLLDTAIGSEESALSPKHFIHLLTELLPMVSFEENCDEQEVKLRHVIRIFNMILSRLLKPNETFSAALRTVESSEIEKLEEEISCVLGYPTREDGEYLTQLVVRDIHLHEHSFVHHDTNCINSVLQPFFEVVQGVIKNQNFVRPENAKAEPATSTTEPFSDVMVVWMCFGVMLTVADYNVEWRLKRLFGDRETSGSSSSESLEAQQRAISKCVPLERVALLCRLNAGLYDDKLNHLCKMTKEEWDKLAHTKMPEVEDIYRALFGRLWERQWAQWKAHERKRRNRKGEAKEVQSEALLSLLQPSKLKELREGTSQLPANIGKRADKLLRYMCRSETVELIQCVGQQAKEAKKPIEKVIPPITRNGTCIRCCADVSTDTMNRCFYFNGDRDFVQWIQCYDEVIDIVAKANIGYARYNSLESILQTLKSDEPTSPTLESETRALHLIKAVRDGLAESSDFYDTAKKVQENIAAEIKAAVELSEMLKSLLRNVREIQPTGLAQLLEEYWRQLCAMIEERKKGTVEEVAALLVGLPSLDAASEERKVALRTYLYEGHAGMAKPQWYKWGADGKLLKCYEAFYTSAAVLAKKAEGGLIHWIYESAFTVSNVERLLAMHNSSLEMVESNAFDGTQWLCLQVLHQLHTSIVATLHQLRSPLPQQLPRQDGGYAEDDEPKRMGQCAIPVLAGQVQLQVMDWDSIFSSCPGKRYIWSPGKVDDAAGLDHTQRKIDLGERTTEKEERAERVRQVLTATHNRLHERYAKDQLSEDEVAQGFGKLEQSLEYCGRWAAVARARAYQDDVVFLLQNKLIPSVSVPKWMYGEENAALSTISSDDLDELFTLFYPGSCSHLSAELVAMMKENELKFIERERETGFLQDHEYTLQQHCMRVLQASEELQEFLDVINRGNHQDLSMEELRGYLSKLQWCSDSIAHVMWHQNDVEVLVSENAQLHAAQNAAIVIRRKCTQSGEWCFCVKMEESQRYNEEHRIQLRSRHSGQEVQCVRGEDPFTTEAAQETLALTIDSLRRNGVHYSRDLAHYAAHEPHDAVGEGEEDSALSSRWLLAVYEKVETLTKTVDRLARLDPTTFTAAGSVLALDLREAVKNARSEDDASLSPLPLSQIIDHYEGLLHKKENERQASLCESLEQLFPRVNAATESWGGDNSVEDISGPTPPSWKEFDSEDLSTQILYAVSTIQSKLGRQPQPFEICVCTPSTTQTDVEAFLEPYLCFARLYPGKKPPASFFCFLIGFEWLNHAIKAWVIHQISAVSFPQLAKARDNDDNSASGVVDSENKETVAGRTSTTERKNGRDKPSTASTAALFGLCVCVCVSHVGLVLPSCAITEKVSEESLRELSLRIPHNVYLYWGTGTQGQAFCDDMYGDSVIDECCFGTEERRGYLHLSLADQRSLFERLAEVEESRRTVAHEPTKSQRLVLRLSVDDCLDKPPGNLDQRDYHTHFRRVRVAETAAALLSVLFLARVTADAGVIELDASRYVVCLDFSWYSLSPEGEPNDVLLKAVYKGGEEQMIGVPTTSRTHAVMPEPWINDRCSGYVMSRTEVEQDSFFSLAAELSAGVTALEDCCEDEDRQEQLVETFQSQIRELRNDGKRTTADGRQWYLPTVWLPCVAVDDKLLSDLESNVYTDELQTYFTGNVEVLKQVLCVFDRPRDTVKETETKGGGGVESFIPLSPHIPSLLSLRWSVGVAGIPALVKGPVGSGKSSLVSFFVHHSGLQHITIWCSAETTEKELHTTIAKFNEDKAGAPLLVVFEQAHHLTSRCRSALLQLIRHGCVDGYYVGLPGTAGDAAAAGKSSISLHGNLRFIVVATVSGGDNLSTAAEQLVAKFPGICVQTPAVVTIRDKEKLCKTVVEHWASSPPPKGIASGGKAYQATSDSAPEEAAVSVKGWLRAFFPGSSQVSGDIDTSVNDFLGSMKTRLCSEMTHSSTTSANLWALPRFFNCFNSLCVLFSKRHLSDPDKELTETEKELGVGTAKFLRNVTQLAIIATFVLCGSRNAVIGVDSDNRQSSESANAWFTSICQRIFKFPDYVKLTDTLQRITFSIMYALYGQCEMGVFICGPPGVGKTLSLELLRRATEPEPDQGSGKDWKSELQRLNPLLLQCTPNTTKHDVEEHARRVCERRSPGELTVLLLDEVGRLRLDSTKWYIRTLVTDGWTNNVDGTRTRLHVVCISNTLLADEIMSVFFLVRCPELRVKDLGEALQCRAPDVVPQTVWEEFLPKYIRFSDVENGLCRGVQGGKEVSWVRALEGEKPRLLTERDLFAVAATAKLLRRLLRSQQGTGEGNNVNGWKHLLFCSLLLNVGICGGDKTGDYVKVFAKEFLSILSERKHASAATEEDAQYYYEAGNGQRGYVCSFCKMILQAQSAVKLYPYEQGEQKMCSIWNGGALAFQFHPSTLFPMVCSLPFCEVEINRSEGNDKRRDYNDFRDYRLRHLHLIGNVQCSEFASRYLLSRTSWQCHFQEDHCGIKGCRHAPPVIETVWGDESPPVAADDLTGNVEFAGRKGSSAHQSSTNMGKVAQCISFGHTLLVLGDEMLYHYTNDILNQFYTRHHDSWRSVVNDQGRSRPVQVHDDFRLLTFGTEHAFAEMEAPLRGRFIKMKMTLAELLPSGEADRAIKFFKSFQNDDEDATGPGYEHAHTRNALAAVIPGFTLNTLLSLMLVHSLFNENFRTLQWHLERLISPAMYMQLLGTYTTTDSGSAELLRYFPFNSVVRHKSFLNALVTAQPPRANLGVVPHEQKSLVHNTLVFTTHRDAFYRLGTKGFFDSIIAGEITFSSRHDIAVLLETVWGAHSGEAKQEALLFRLNVRDNSEAPRITLATQLGYLVRELEAATLNDATSAAAKATRIVVVVLYDGADTRTDNLEWLHTFSSLSSWHTVSIDELIPEEYLCGLDEGSLRAARLERHEGRPPGTQEGGSNFADLSIELAGYEPVFGIQLQQDSTTACNYLVPVLTGNEYQLEGYVEQQAKRLHKKLSDSDLHSLGEQFLKLQFQLSPEIIKGALGSSLRGAACRFFVEELHKAITELAAINGTP